MIRRERFIHQKKSLGQVFLNTDWPVRRVVEQLQKWGAERVLEIGPGGGILTGALHEAGFTVTAVERDGRFAARLRDVSSGWTSPERLEVVDADVLKFDLPAWIASSSLPAAVVGNIPYNISTPILIWLLPHLRQLVGADFMVQLEFARRLASECNTKDYGSLSVYAQLRARVEMECKVERSCFTPVPKVDSALVCLLPKKDILPEEVLARVEALTRLAFQQRRKMLRNSVKLLCPEELDESKLPIDLSRRAETLRPDEFVALAQALPRTPPKT